MWLSLILALRIGLAAYNVTYFYIPFLVTIYPPLWVGIFMFIVTFVSIDKLLTRRDDITKRSVKSFFTVRLSNIHDRRLIKTASANKKQEEPLKKELEHFIDCITDNKKPLISGHEGREALKVALQINKKIWEAHQNISS